MNFLDVVGQFCYFIFVILYIFSCREASIYNIYNIAVFSQLWKGMLSFFKWTTRTSFLVKMVIEVMKELIPFLCVLAGQNMLFATIFIATD
jgi:hypothetical protein